MPIKKYLQRFFHKSKTIFLKLFFARKVNLKRLLKKIVK